MKHAQEIIGNEEFDNLKQEFWDELDNGASYNDIEDLMLDYGLEMDYLFDVIGF